MNRRKLFPFWIVLLLFSVFTFSQKKESKANCLLEKNENFKNKKMKLIQKNVLGNDLELASINPLTGFFRTGYCQTDSKDNGVHVVAAIMTDKFLKYSLSKGNDLISANPLNGFPGLKAGDVWCLCANRWKDAMEADVAPPIILESTNIKTLDFISLDALKKFSHKN